MKQKDSAVQFAPMEELMPLIRESLAAGQTVRFSPRGVSMLPMLRQGKDAVEFSPLPRQLKKYDLPIYRYPNGKYVMHRIVGVTEDGFLCLGDNTYSPERVSGEQMLAVVSAFRRGDRWIPVTDPGYRLYCRLWCGCYPLRRFAKRAVNWLRRHLR